MTPSVDGPLIRTWKACSTLANYIEDGPRLEYGSWRMWGLSAAKRHQSRAANARWSRAATETSAQRIVEAMQIDEAEENGKASGASTDDHQQKRLWPFHIEAEASTDRIASPALSPSSVCSATGASHTPAERSASGSMPARQNSRKRPASHLVECDCGMNLPGSAIAFVDHVGTPNSTASAIDGAVRHGTGNWSNSGISALSPPSRWAFGSETQFVSQQRERCSQLAS